MPPIALTENWFKFLNAWATKIYRKNKKPKIAIATLQDNKWHDGLEAVQICIIMSQSTKIFNQMDTKENLQWLTDRCRT